MVPFPTAPGKVSLKCSRLKFWGVEVDGDDVETGWPSCGRLVPGIGSLHLFRGIGTSTSSWFQDGVVGRNEVFHAPVSFYMVDGFFRCLGWTHVLCPVRFGF